MDGGMKSTAFANFRASETNLHKLQMDLETAKLSQSSKASLKQSTQSLRYMVPNLSLNDVPSLIHPKSDTQINSMVTPPVSQKSLFVGKNPEPQTTAPDVDIKSAETGMFSDIMFKDGNHKAVPIFRIIDTDTEVLNSSSSSSTSSSSSNSEGPPPIILHRQVSKHTSPPISALPSKPRTSSFTQHLTKDRTLSHTQHNVDKKRLVDQFLDSIEGPTASQSYTPLQDDAHRDLSLDYLNSMNKQSLQNILYRDLGNNSANRSVLDLTKFSTPNVSSPPNISSVEDALCSSANSNQDISGFEIPSDIVINDYDRELQELGLNLRLRLPKAKEEQPKLIFNFNELNTSQQHIKQQLDTFEEWIKENYRDLVLNDEIVLSKNLQLVDTLEMTLKAMKQEVINLRVNVELKYLKVMETDFNEDDKDSFISKIAGAIQHNVASLDSLEARLEMCKQKLNNQRGRLRKMESILAAENASKSDEVNSSRKARWFSILLDILVLLFVFLVSAAIVKVMYQSILHRVFK